MDLLPRTSLVMDPLLASPRQPETVVRQPDRLDRQLGRAILKTSWSEAVIRRALPADHRIVAIMPVRTRHDDTQFLIEGPLLAPAADQVVSVLVTMHDRGRSLDFGPYEITGQWISREFDFNPHSWSMGVFPTVKEAQAFFNE